MRLSLRAFGVVLVLFSSCAPGSSQSGNTYHRKYNTIAHRLLDIEAVAEPIPDSARQLLDDLIAEALERIGRPTEANTLEDQRGFARAALAAIDQVLTKHNFVFPPEGLVDTLGDALVPHKLAGLQLAEVRARGSNYHRRAQIDRNAASGGDFYFIDCKTSSIIYLGIAELDNLPLVSVDIPGHIFVRWSSGTLTMDWDTNLGEVTDDEFYQEEAAIPPDLVRRGVFLSNMSQDSLLGYWHDLVGARFEKLKVYDRAFEEHKKAVALYPISGMEQNNLGWFLATCPGAKCRNGTEAISAALASIKIWENPSRLDTLAAAYAENHQWVIAANTEIKAKTLSRLQRRSGFESDPLPDFDKYIDAYKHHKTYVEVTSESTKPLRNDYHPVEAAKDPAE